MSDKPTDGAFTANFEYKLFSGHMTGRVQSADPTQTPDTDIARNIHAAVAQAFRQVPSDLAAKIEVAVSANDFVAAAQEVERGLAEGVFGFAPTPELFAALQKIELTALDANSRKSVRLCRMVSAQMLRRFDVAASEAEILLTEHGLGLTDEEKADFEMMVAIGAVTKGHEEAALATWRRLLTEPSILGAESRGWAWRNISITLEKTSIEARAAARHSADAFLQAGNKEEAGTSLMRLIDGLMGIDPQEAINTLDELLTLVDQSGIRNDELKAAAFHARAHRLMSLGQFPAALADAQKAVALRHGLFGAEEGLVSSLHLAALVATNLGRTDDANALSDEADRITGEAGLSHFALARRVTELAGKFDPAGANALIADARAAGNRDILAGVEVIRAMQDPSLKDEERLASLEATVASMQAEKGPVSVMPPAQLALGDLLARMGQPDRAIPWYERAIEADPWFLPARDRLVQCLWNTKKWSRAIEFLKKEITLRGEHPGLQFALGKSLVEDGRYSEAIPVLTKSYTNAPPESGLKTQAFAMRERALQNGGTLVSPPPPTQPKGSIDSVTFEAALAEFAKYVAAEKRMRFWTRDDAAKYRWVERPERQAQDLLHTFLKGKYGNRISVFEEIAAGAGRLDILIQLEGGLGAIVELKMCGFGYSSSYAAAGEDQILHYMENRDICIGYLVVFDARLSDYAKPLLAGHSADKFTVREHFIDVRPRVAARGRS